MDRELAKPVFDEAAERARVRRVDRQWQAAVDQLEGTPTGVGSARDDAADPEDVFEAHVNDAIAGVERLVDRLEE